MFVSRLRPPTERYIRSTCATIVWCWQFLGLSLESAKGRDGRVDELATELMQLMQEEVQAISDTIDEEPELAEQVEAEAATVAATTSGGAAARPGVKKATMSIKKKGGGHQKELLDYTSKVVDALNKLELGAAATKSVARPTWTYFKPTDNLNSISMAEMRAKYSE
jgi:uncharacterized membrane protein